MNEFKYDQKKNYYAINKKINYDCDTATLPIQNAVLLLCNHLNNEKLILCYWKNRSDGSENIALMRLFIVTKKYINLLVLQYYLN